MIFQILDLKLAFCGHISGTSITYAQNRYLPAAPAGAVQAIKKGFLTEQYGMK